ncbi:MAG: hypothetical protein ACK45U_09335 [bacterium]|jgi:hypothetical protein
MKILSLVFLSILLVACSTEPNKNSISDNYAFNIDKIVDQQIASIKSDSLCKFLINDSIVIEQVKIEAEKIKNDLLDLKNYDINKPAFKNSFEVIESDSLITYKSKDSSTSIKSINVYGDVNHPTKIQIEIINLNNLYESTKLIELKFKEYIRIKTIQNVKLMSSDTIDIVSYLNGNCAITSSILSTGK